LAASVGGLFHFIHSKREALENVFGHIEALESEYRNRREELEKKVKSAIAA
jgi:hypothetical protein